MTEVVSKPISTEHKQNCSGIQIDDFWVAIQYEGDSRILPWIPKSLSELNMHIGKCYNLKDSNKYIVFYVDQENDKIDINHNRDLKNAYKVWLNSNKEALTVYVWRKDQDKPIMSSYLNNKGVKDKNSWDLPSILNSNEKRSKRKSELKPVITRNLHKYHLHWRYKDHIYYKWENYVNMNCSGIWKIKINFEKEEGELFREHTARFEDHTYTREILHQNRILEEEINSLKSEHSLMITIPVQYQFQNIGILKQDEIKILNDIKGFTIQKLNQNGMMTRNDFIAACSKMPDFFNIMQTQLPLVDHIFADCQKQIHVYKKKESHFESLISQLPDVSKAINPIFGLIPLTFDINKATTLRHTQFGRDILWSVDKTTGDIRGAITFLQYI